jgi:hypothetical protein
MGTFCEDLDLRYLDGCHWRLLGAFTYRHPTATISVPAGFETDFASIPRFFWRVLPPTGKYGKAAVVHDYIYRTPSVPLTRAEADQVFLDAMADLGVGRMTRSVMYRAVRVFGGRAYQARG